MVEFFSFIFVVAAILLLFGITVFVHELGHFLVARWCGLEVETFAIGFGPAFWKKEYKGVVYKLCILPLGG
ncbi:MAG: site-2 protease family protein, partial [Verrucomicrobiota bacterium]